MRKAELLTALAAQRHASTDRLAAAGAGGGDAEAAAGLAERLAEADHAAARGRVAALAAPLDLAALRAAPPVAVETAVARAEAAGQRLQRRARLLPAPLWGLRSPVAGASRTLGALARLRVLREWAAVGEPALGPPWPKPVAAVAAALSASALERIPAEVLPTLEVRAGVVRLVVADLPDRPVRRQWGVDFARRHYGPRVTAEPDAIVRTWGGELALLLEGRATPEALSDLEVEGDAELAAALLGGLSGGVRGAAD